MRIAVAHLLRGIVAGPTAVLALALTRPGHLAIRGLVDPGRG